MGTSPKRLTFKITSCAKREVTPQVYLYHVSIFVMKQNINIIRFPGLHSKTSFPVFEVTNKAKVKPRPVRALSTSFLAFVSQGVSAELSTYLLSV